MDSFKRPLLLNPLQSRVTQRSGFPVMRGAFPVVGHLPALVQDPLRFDRLAEREVGPIFWKNVGFGLWQLQCLLPDAFEIFRNSAATPAFIRDNLYDLFGEAMNGQDGAKHRHQRSAMSAPFSPRGISASGVGAEFAAIIERHVHGWIARSEVAMLPSTREMALAVILRMLGVKDQDLSAWRRDYETFMLVAINLPVDLPFSPRRRGLAARARLDVRIAALVREARSRSEDQGLLAQLSRGVDEDGRGLDDRELYDNLRFLILAGHETTASVMAWMMVTLSERHDVWHALLAEARSAGDVPRSPSDLKSFPYAEAVFRETLRLYPPATRHSRLVREQLTLGGRLIPADTTIGLSLIHLSRHPDLYERPDEFVPERWLNKSASPSPIELVQFGGGPHFCLGYHIAWMEAVQFAVILARALGPRGLRPALFGATPAPRYLPLLHPDSKARVRFVPR